jgi:paraquat-inducible protein A
MIPPSTVGGPASQAEAVLRECPGCGLFQIEPALSPGMTARCERGTTLRRTRQHPLEHSLALAVAALILLTVMCLSMLMTVHTSGIVHRAGMFSGPAELVRRGMSDLAPIVVFITVVAPLCKLLGTIYVLLRIREATPPRHLRRIFAWVERLSTWSMVGVFVLGVFVSTMSRGQPRRSVKTWENSFEAH